MTLLHTCVTTSEGSLTLQQIVSGGGGGGGEGLTQEEVFLLEEEIKMQTRVPAQLKDHDM